MGVDLWVEKYRPKTMNDYVWHDQHQRQIAEEWIEKGALPHLLFGGVQGTGKTSLAKLMLKLLDIPKGDILEINASRDRNVDVVQNKVINFASSWALGPSGMKYVLLDEADRMSPLAQDVLRHEMERFHDSCRFILTCNHPQKIIPPINSRCQSFMFQKLDKEDFVARFGQILMDENVSFEIETLQECVDLTYPDLRKCINLAQQNVLDGVLLTPKNSVSDVDGIKDYLLDAIDMFRSRRYLEARKLIINQADVEEYVGIYQYLAKNLDIWGDTEQQQDQALIVVRNGLLNHAVIADPELNLSATIIELKLIKENT